MENNKRKVAFTTLGCKVNMYDTEAMKELFKNRNYEVVDFDSFADIYLINTCTVTNFGDKKSRQMIRRAKRINPNSIVIAAGCYAQTAPCEIEKIEGVNIIIGNKNRSNIVDIVENYSKRSDGILKYVYDIMDEHDFEELSINRIEGRTRAYLKIQEGCNRFCSYCIIPFARGSVRSRKPENVINEVKRLSKNGFKEIVLTGIHVASYGADIGGIDLIKIIEMVHDVDGIERIRFSSVEPNIFTMNFLTKLKSLNKVCDHFHLSLQSGCDKILKRMNRHYNCSQYRNAVYNIRKFYKDAAITTDVIVGFPGETDNDFIETCNFVQDIELSKIHVFPFSSKKGTAASKFSDVVETNIKNIRAKKLIAISDKLNKNFMERFINLEKSVLFERLIEKDIYEGHTSNYITVRTNSDIDIVNNIKNVKIEKIIKDETVFGKLI